MLPMPRRAPEAVMETSRAFIARHFGEAGRAWLEGLPVARAATAARWQLELGPALPGGLLAAVNLVTRRDGSPAVLKLSGPWGDSAREVAALRAWEGGGAPRVLDFEPEAGAILLERIEPGTHPAEAPAARVATLLARLHVDPPAGLPYLAEVVRRRIGKALGDGRTSSAKAAWARAKLVELEDGSPPGVLLHGDFDERNLLVCVRRGLCAIDPHPCVGDPAYDAGYWVHGNRRPGRGARLDALVALGFERARVRDWAAVVGVHG